MIDFTNSHRALPASSVRPQPFDGADAPGGEAVHILVPVTLAERDFASVRMGLQMAAGTQARLTLLHVAEEEPENHSRNWLDAIDQLHARLDGGLAPVRREVTTESLQTYFSPLLTPSILAKTQPNFVARMGEFSDEVSRFAETQGVDLVVLSGDLLQGWIPMFPTKLRRKLQQLGKRVLAIWPEESGRAATPAASRSTEPLPATC
ncbi:hypothetical protein Pan44_24880 [Caulifigura coniformis]|uniref:UspA domain-containing protein n=1 Tax=Caulifigura coniformis TaxID=2527983 RepID=A0A517SE97_9PLAN|nr:universal stress protein [Caulifigura coniformis]QDT54455.1 hypothetical protein Pan44_24880 [Caulifigura coniformis]